MRRGDIPAEAPPLESVISEDIELAAMDDEEAPGQQTEEIHRTGGRFTTWKGPSAECDECEGSGKGQWKGPPCRKCGGHGWQMGVKLPYVIFCARYRIT